jgi:hypothetical protein
MGGTVRYINALIETQLSLITAQIVAKISGIFLIPYKEEFIFEHIDDYVKSVTTDLTTTILLHIDLYQ